MDLLRRLFTPHVLIGIVIVAGVLWAVSIIRSPERPLPVRSAAVDEPAATVAPGSDVPPAAASGRPVEPAESAEPPEPDADVESATRVILPALTDIMSRDFIMLWQEASAGSALQLLRQRDISPEAPLELYVIDRINRLQGIVTARQLLVAPPTAPLKDFMQTEVAFIQTDASQTEMARLLGQTRERVVPVVDRDRKIVGIVDTEEFFESIEISRAETPAPRPQAVRPEAPAEAASPKPAATSRKTPEQAPATAKTETPPEAEPVTPVTMPPRVVGVRFMDGMIAPMDYELNQRFWGWRPNDLIQFTDNVNNFQMGTLETTRRAAIILAESISRTGNVESFDPNVESAMNWFMVKADQFWLPSAESKFKDGLKELEAYKKRLEAGQSRFYNRSDNLLPLLRTFVHLLGSCDDMLTRTHESDGSRVSFFKVDDYFYYSQGVANAMFSILQAVETDFQVMLRNRNAENVLQVILANLERATEIKPWIILDSSYSSIFANHRANLVAPISNARFYLDVLIETLST